MEKVIAGKFVQVHYKGSFINGETFDSSQGRLPLEVQMGCGQVIPGFEQALMGMAVNETKTFTVEPAQAYGERDETRVLSFQRSQIPAEMNPSVGDTVALTSDDGQQIPARVTVADSEKIEVDWNHPLAGKSLVFEIQVMGVTDGPTQMGCGSCSCGDTPDESSCGGCSCD